LRFASTVVVVRLDIAPEVLTVAPVTRDTMSELRVSKVASSRRRRRRA
jgi:hypothetical protein